ncbi:hypothetical protein [Flavobacterium sp. KMS]|uniref:hypothetical protein n=1 Tax=Flavobacterium sp. KMS TaxID=1566023 RepID=UPI000A555960|nr:hypothetical protein [Flavobacterium sp. KMS]
MKMNKSKKEINKFDLEKFSVAKLKNSRSINGGKAPGDDKTLTNSMKQDGQTF